MTEPHHFPPVPVLERPSLGTWHARLGAPFDRLLRHWGGIPVNRREPAGMMATLTRALAEEREFRVAITPEGTRAHAGHWKSGFCRLARAANVPVALAFID